MSNAVLELQGVGAELPYQGGGRLSFGTSASRSPRRDRRARRGIGIREVDDGENDREVTP